MATNTYAPENKDRTWKKILRFLGKSTTLGEVGGKNLGHVKKRTWAAPGTPSTLQAQYATAPHNQLQIGDLCYDSTNKLTYVCTVEVAATTDATWTLISID